MLRRTWLDAALVVACAMFALPVAVIAHSGADGIDDAFARATQLHQSGDIEGAIRGYESILAKHPERVDVRSNLGAAYSRLGRYEDAIAQYQQALKTERGNET